MHRSNSTRTATRTLTEPTDLQEALRSAPPPDRREDARKEEKDEPDSLPSRKRWFFIIGAVVLLGIAAGVLWYLHSRNFESTDDAFIEGHIIPISPRVAGQVTRVLIDDNVEVEAGALLVEVDPRDYQVARDRAAANVAAAQAKVAQAQAQVPGFEAALAQARAQIAAAEATAQNAKSEFGRSQALRSTAVISKREFEASTETLKTSSANLEAIQKNVGTAEAQIAAGKAAVEAAEAQLEQAQVDERQAELQLSYTRIVAPEAGRITRKNVEPGAYVQPGAALFSIVPRDVWIVANFKETQLTHMQSGQRVDVKVDAFPHRDLHAHIESFQRGTGSRFSLLPPENATGNYVKIVQRLPVKVVFDEGPDVLRQLAPGMSAVPRVHLR